MADELITRGLRVTRMEQLLEVLPTSNLPSEHSSANKSSSTT
jgi:hypothetical protein